MNTTISFKHEEGEVVTVNTMYELRFGKKTSGGTIYYAYKNGEPHKTDNDKHIFLLVSKKMTELSYDLVIEAISRKPPEPKKETTVKIKGRATFKDDDCPKNLLLSRTNSNPYIRISGALCEAIKLNHQWIVQEALEQLTIDEIKELLKLKEV